MDWETDFSYILLSLKITIYIGKPIWSIRDVYYNSSFQILVTIFNLFDSRISCREIFYDDFELKLFILAEDWTSVHRDIRIATNTILVRNYEGLLMRSWHIECNTDYSTKMSHYLNVVSFELLTHRPMFVKFLSHSFTFWIKVITRDWIWRYDKSRSNL